jgi:hypothetical protein
MLLLKILKNYRRERRGGKVIITESRATLCSQMKPWDKAFFDGKWTSCSADTKFERRPGIMIVEKRNVTIGYGGS